ncbi:hypothetical protein HDU90_004783 [Geranomyces variabilis]|nr:hypothetical protein HDU90_004783 [Geranomyces variabilis]
MPFRRLNGTASPYRVTPTDLAQGSSDFRVCKILQEIGRRSDLSTWISPHLGVRHRRQCATGLRHGRGKAARRSLWTGTKKYSRRQSSVSEMAGNIIAALATIDAVVGFLNSDDDEDDADDEDDELADVTLAALRIKPGKTVEVVGTEKTHVRDWAGFGGPCRLSASKAEDDELADVTLAALSIKPGKTVEVVGTEKTHVRVWGGRSTPCRLPATKAERCLQRQQQQRQQQQQQGSSSTTLTAALDDMRVRRARRPRPKKRSADSGAASSSMATPYLRRRWTTSRSRRSVRPTLMGIPPLSIKKGRAGSGCSAAGGAAGDGVPEKQSKKSKETKKSNASPASPMPPIRRNNGILEQAYECAPDAYFWSAAIVHLQESSGSLAVLCSAETMRQAPSPTSLALDADFLVAVATTRAGRFLVCSSCRSWFLGTSKYEMFQDGLLLAAGGSQHAWA